MGVITKIRNRSTLVVAAVGIAIVAFILNDFLSSSGRFFSDQETNVAVIDGKAVSSVVFATRLDNEISQRFPNGANDRAQRSVRNLLWDQIIFENLMVPKGSELGLGVTSREFYASLESNTPPSAIREYFSNPQTGQLIPDFTVPGTNKLNSARVAQYIQQLETNDQIQQFLPIESSVRKELFENKYYNLISKAVYTTTNEAKVDQVNRKQNVSFSYVVQKYNQLADDQVEYTDADLKAYWSKHNYLPDYQQDFQSRSIEYVVFKAIPTAADSAELRTTCGELADRFKKAAKDTAFVIQNNNGKGDVRWMTPTDLTELLSVGRDTLALNTDSGEVFGPYLDAAADPSGVSTYNLMKVLDLKMSPDSANARQIVCAYEADSAGAKNLADSLLAVLEGGGDFAALALEYSDDAQTSSNGGELGMKKETEMAPRELADKVFGGTTGDFFVIESVLGYHVVEVMDQTEPVKKILAAIVDMPITPSRGTRNKAFDDASAFAIKNQSDELFASEGSVQGIKSAPDLKEDQQDIFGLETARPVIRWAFGEAELGDIRKEPFELGVDFVVPRLIEIKEKGTLSVDVPSIREKVIAEVIKEKKAEVFKGQQSNASDIDKLASELGAVVEKVDRLNFASFAIPGIGAEQKLIGTVFALGQGDIVGPMAGDIGVFTVRIDEVNEAGEIGVAEIAGAKQNVTRAIAGRVNVDVYNALLKSAEVVDNRAKFY